MTSSLLASLVVVLGTGMARGWVARLGPKRVVAPLLFVLTRWPVLLVSSTTSIATLFLAGPASKGIGDLALFAGIGAMVGVGLAMLVVGVPFAILRALQPDPELALAADERVARSTSANHFLRGESRGGMLVTTDRRVIFQPHRFNVQLDAWSAPLDALGPMAIDGERLLAIDAQWFAVERPRALLAELRHDALERVRNDLLAQRT